MWVYLFRSVKARLIENIAIVSVIAVVVCTSTLILTFGANLRAASLNAGDPQQVVFLSKGSMGEKSSSIDKATYDAVRVLPEIKVENGVPLVSPELVNGVTLKSTAGVPLGIPVRGVDPIVFQVRNQVRIEKGRQAQAGANEVIIGSKLEGTLPDFQVGGSWGKRKIVGVFSANGSLLETEIWLDRRELAQIFDRQPGNDIGIILVRTPSAEESQRIITQEAVKPSIGLLAMTEAEFFDWFFSTGRVMAHFALVFSLVLALGASIAAASTLYSALLGRSTEFATLHAIGATRRQIGMLALQESILLSLSAAIIGVALALAFNGQELARLWTDDPFSHFGIHIGALAIGQGLLLGLIVGLIGGLIPALAIRRMDMRQAIG